MQRGQCIPRQDIHTNHRQGWLLGRSSARLGPCSPDQNRQTPPLPTRESERFLARKTATLRGQKSQDVCVLFHLSVDREASKICGWWWVTNGRWWNVVLSVLAIAGHHVVFDWFCASTNRQDSSTLNLAEVLVELIQRGSLFSWAVKTQQQTTGYPCDGQRQCQLRSVHLNRSKFRGSDLAYKPSPLEA